MLQRAVESKASRKGGGRMTNLIVNADDFGFSKGVNLGIVEAYTNGIVTSATLMVNMPDKEHAAQLAKAHPQLGVGIHLVLTCGSPISTHVPSLVNEQGEFYSQQEAMKYAESADIERECHEQIQAFFSLGLTPTHIDSHHHVHAHGKVAPIVARLAEQYGLPVRKLRNDSSERVRHQRLHTTVECLTDFYGQGATKDNLIRMFDQAKGRDVVEIMCHPAYVDVRLLNGSSYNTERVRELEILTNPEIRTAVGMRQLELISYRELKHQTHI